MNKHLLPMIIFTALTTFSFCTSADWYVAPAGNDSNDGTSWGTAKQTIQAAVDAATNGAVIWVTNGMYSTGGRTAAGQALTNRVAVDKPLTVRSVNGPSNTLIAGAADPLYTNGNASVRCVYLTTNAELVGFTLTNGHTHASGDWAAYAGGGVWCAASNAVLSNCVVIGNRALTGGGRLSRNLSELPHHRQSSQLRRRSIWGDNL